jgi:tRNA 2-selenouridine synthase
MIALKGVPLRWISRFPLVRVSPMPTLLTVDAFLTAPGMLLDTRSPGEYQQGRIPGALNLPLFTNEERAQVGTCYKHQGQAAAVELGLAIVGPKLVTFVQTAKQLAQGQPVRLHCWRGGMRSSSMAWLLETAGFEVTVLVGGYKAFRQWVRATLATPKPIVTLGGMTGTGKTQMLYALAQQGEQILDLEALANHRGSSYGALGLTTQPSDEQFANEIAIQWQYFSAQQPLWIEAEGRRIGLCRVPDEIFRSMLRAPIVQLERDRTERIALLEATYETIDREELIAATTRLTRKLGGQQTQIAIDQIRQGHLAAAIDIVLDYYDKAYRYDLNRRQVPIYAVPIGADTMAETVARLIGLAREIGVLEKFPPGHPPAV